MPSREFYLAPIEKELATGREASAAGNGGRARVCARRAAGLAISWYLTRHPDPEYGRDALRQLTRLKEDAIFPQPARDAARRLTTRITAGFTYPFSEDPLSDARIIIDHIITVMANDPS
jgi:hypothetical protein